ncbi:serine/threonine protein kinase [Paraburkholderia sp. RP-4-7]|uniref:Serine/threonine protein kinase n=1 Tax=Paraburkholderia polaris TaxID=2728848 RepID=A0A848I8A2_9BURK|nr:serine/threonine-protein kinase [Paraburkholderia polaris]NML98551.1 serine/threonine protein kinase [Paraburkholderia polaris]
MYEIVKELGHGGFGRVYEVYNAAANPNRAAMKTLEPAAGIVNDVGIVELTARFAREVRYQSAVKHPNVVEILGSDLSANPPAFFMPLADCTLEQELERDPTLGGAPLPILFGILAGLEALHAAGYVHRDLKPSNVLRFSEQGFIRYAVSDFGLMSSPNSNSTTLTPSDVGGGTPYYAAPELAVNLRRATAAADIYSFGAILHDIFVRAKRTPYSQLQGPGAIGAVIEKCTRRSPRLRYRDVVELREDLFKALDGYVPTFSSNEEGHVVAMLNAVSDMTEDQWDRVLALLDTYQDKRVAPYNLFKAMNAAHFTSLAAASVDIFVAIAADFCEHVIQMAFDFDYCDILASKLEAVFNAGPVESKALSLVALLELGAGHNRWFVERKFMQLASKELDPQVAQRFVVEAVVQNVDVKQRVAHVEHSIGATRQSLSPIIQAAL